MPDKANFPPEPSMEEIIASISRIITEDKKPDEPSRNVRDAHSDVLELTEAVNEDGSVRHVSPSHNTAVPTGESAASGNSSMPGTGAPAEPAPAEREAGIEPKLDVGRERIVSTATSGAVAAAFAQLGTLPRERREAELPLGASDRTLESVVRDMLRPYLETWLNEHLPGIVERLVRQEIARVIGEAGLR